MGDYGTFRSSLCRDIALKALAPSGVAAVLERERSRFPQITQGEIDGLKRLGSAWGGSTAPAAEQAELWAEGRE